jgi:hypothetical protein
VKDKKDILNQAVERLTTAKVSSGPPQEVADATVARLTEMSGSSEQPNIWRKIMKSKITKYAAATIIMIAGLLFLTFIDKIPFCEKLLHDHVNSEFQIGMK